MIGAEFADRLSGRPALPVFDPDDGCPICHGPHGRCVGPGVAHTDTASRIREYVVARGQQQTRRAPGRPHTDPAKEEERQAEWAAKQEVADKVETAVAQAEAGSPLSPAGHETSGAVDPGALVAEPVEASAMAEEVTAVAGPVSPAVPISTDPAVQTLSPISAPGRTIDPDAESPRFTDTPTLVRTPDGFKSQAVDYRAVSVAVPATDPTEVRDVYTVPAGVIDPVDDPHRPDPATTVLVSDAAQLVSTGAWTTLPGGTSIATTRKVLRVWYPMGTLSPSYSTVADAGVVLPKPVGTA